MRKLFATLCLCSLFFVGIASWARAAEMKSENMTRRVNCLVLSNTGHFDNISPITLREKLSVFGGVDYTVIKDLQKLKVEDMLKYDVVWIYNFAEWGMASEDRYGNIKPENLNNLLGDYVEKGGALLESMYISYINPLNTLGLGDKGKYTEGEYSPFVQTSTLNSSTLNMGEVFVPNHPIMKDIRAVSTNVSTYRTVASKGATAIAEWQETEAILVAVKNKVVALNMAPIHANENDPMLGIGCWLYGDAARLIDNSIKWLFSEVHDTLAPNAILDFKIESRPRGSSYDMVMSWKNPSKRINGSSLESLDSLCVFRDNVKIATLKTLLDIGAQVSYTDIAVSVGDHEYNVIAYSSGKVGYPCYASIFSGNDVPSAVSSFVLAPKGNNGSLTWKAPTKGKRNGWLDVSTLKYNITRLPDNIEVASAVTATSYVDENIPETKEYSYKITPYTKDGDGVQSITFPFTLRTDGAIWMGTSNITTCSAKFYDCAGPNAGIEEKEKTYLLILNPENPESGSRLSVNFTKFDIKGMELIVLDGDNAEAPAIVGSPFRGTEVFSQMAPITASAANKSGALTFIYTITQGNAKGSGWEADITCVNLKNKDVKVESLTGDILPVLGKTYEYEAMIKNNGLQAVSNITIKLYKGRDEVIATKTIDTILQPGITAAVVFPFVPSAEGDVILTVKTELAGDEEATNNVSIPLMLSVQPVESHVVKVGAGDVSTFFGPINTFYKHSVTETMYYPQELGVTKGKIKAIRYYTDFGREMRNVHVKIHISEIDHGDMSYGFIDESKMTLVFDGIISFPFGENEVPIKFTTPYDYNGKNLVIRVERPLVAATPRGDMGQNFYVFFDDAHKNRQIAYRSDDKAFNVEDPEFKYDFNNTPPHTSFVFDCQQAGHISGTIKDINQKNVDSVKVSLKKSKLVTYTDTSGKYTFLGLQAGKDTAVCEKFGYEIVSSNAQVTLAQTLTLDIVLPELRKIKMSGIVVDNTGDPINGAEVELKGYFDYFATTDAVGKYEFSGIYTDRNYAFNAKKDLFASYSATFRSGLADTIADTVVLTQFNIPAFGVKATAEKEDVSAKIEWIVSSDMDFKRYVYDDGSAETAYSVAEGMEGWFGSFFGMKDSGYIQSVDIYGARNYYIEEGEVGQRTVTIDIYDQKRKLIASSEPFSLLSNTWTTVNLPYIPYNGAFYAMVHFTKEAGLTHMIGCDYNGPYAEAELNYYSDGSMWAVVQTAATGVIPFSFLIRANVFESREAASKGLNRTFSAKPSSDPLSYDLMSVAECQKTDNESAAKCALGASLLNNSFPKSYTPMFKVYRYKKKDMGTPSAWTLVTTSPINGKIYEDTEWINQEVGIYGYAVQALYGEKMKSEYAHSDFVFKNMLANVTFNISSNTTSLNAGEATIELYNCDEEDTEHMYSAVADENGRAVFSQIWKGKYRVVVSKYKFARMDTIIDFSLNDEYTKDFVLLEDLRPAYNLEILKNESGLQVFEWNESINISDGIEAHTDFTMDSPGKHKWTYRDVNGVLTYSMANADFPHNGDAGAFLVFNPATTTPAIEYASAAPHGGKKYLVSFASPLAPNDKWIISPKLYYNGSFTFKFFTKTFDATAGLERFQAGYSTGGMDAADFKWIQGGDFASAPMKWGEHSYTIPGNANYVAFRCISNDQYMLMLDDLFIGNEQVSEDGDNIKEYEVYLDGVFVAKTTEKNYSFANVDDQKKHKAGVVVVYSTGKSPMEELTFGGLLNEELNSLNQVKVYPNPASDVVFLEGTKDVRCVEIHTLSGGVIENITVNAQELRINVSSYTSGVYFIKLIGENNSTVKKFVKR